MEGPDPPRPSITPRAPSAPHAYLKRSRPSWPVEIELRPCEGFGQTGSAENFAQMRATEMRSAPAEAEALPESVRQGSAVNGFLAEMLYQHVIDHGAVFVAFRLAIGIKHGFDSIHQLRAILEHCRSPGRSRW